MAKKRKNRKPGICVYCGREALLTEDHIPPKNLYPESLHSKLLKIPSCLICNGGASKDDEYLRTMIGLNAKGQGDENLQPLANAAVRALRRPQAAGFKQSVIDGLKQGLVAGSSGVLRPVVLGTLDLHRFDR